LLRAAWYLVTTRRSKHTHTHTTTREKESSDLKATKSQTGDRKFAFSFFSEMLVTAKKAKGRRQETKKEEL